MSKPWTPRRIAAITAAVLHRQGQQGGVIFPAGQHATLAAGDGVSILVDVADPTGPNGMRSFVLAVREV